MRVLTATLILTATLTAGCATADVDYVDHRPDPTAHDLGDDPVLDRLWASCAATNVTACDELARIAPPLSEYARFAREDR